MTQTSQLEQAFKAFDELYRQEQSTDTFEGNEYPKEYLYSLRMLEVLNEVFKNASEVQALACKAQHLCRWEIPRSTYPDGKQGYHAWRQALYKYQGNKAAEVLSNIGYDEDTIASVQEAIGKSNMRKNFNSQVVEDVACLVFMKYYINDFAAKHASDEEKMIGIIQKTWNKMSPVAHDHALQIPFKTEVADLIKKALKMGRG